MPKELVIAPPAVIDVILHRAVRPVVIRFERSLKTSLFLKVLHGVKPNVTTDEIAGEGKNYKNGTVAGNATISVRLNYGGNRFLFHVDCVFPKTLSPKTGFSGFHIPGAVTVTGDHVRLDQKGHTVAYNSWDLPDRTRSW
jgi:hypothetical protein